jgi:hypothetical protein
VTHLISKIKQHFALKVVAFAIAALFEAVIVLKPTGVLSTICGFAMLPGAVPALLVLLVLDNDDWSTVALMLGVAILVNSVIYYYFLALLGRAFEELQDGNPA